MTDKKHIVKYSSSFFWIRDVATKKDHFSWFLYDEEKKRTIEVDLIVTPKCRVQGDRNSSCSRGLDASRINIQHGLKMEREISQKNNVCLFLSLEWCVRCVNTKFIDQFILINKCTATVTKVEDILHEMS